MTVYIYKDTFNSCLNELSDLSHQINIWANLNNPLNLINSYTETLCGIFDDALVGEALDEGAIIYDNSVTQAIHELDVMTNTIREGNKDIIAFINSSEMQRIRDKALEILKLISVSSFQGNNTVFLELGESVVFEDSGIIR